MIGRRRQPSSNKVTEAEPASKAIQTANETRREVGRVFEFIRRQTPGWGNCFRPWKIRLGNSPSMYAATSDKMLFDNSAQRERFLEFE
jgi:hypothetical protein